MAKPRVFISSTYYDLRNVRSDLERFIREQGYDPIMFERGSIAYGAEERLEEDCYREISTCDILINLIGGKFGSESSDSKYSISQNELKTAIKLGKQIYIFIEKSVHAEYATYVANKNVKGFTPTSMTSGSLVSSRRFSRCQDAIPFSRLRSRRTSWLFCASNGQGFFSFCFRNMRGNAR
jgi:Domain of unknown function (DUF4062)